MLRSLLLAALMTTTLPAAVAVTLPNQPVPVLDLQRYTGQWHEIAHLPMYFQRKCLGAVIATYTPNPDGSIHVHNTCRTGGGIASVDGVAKITPDQPAALKVRFVPKWLTWLPQAWADYWVIEVAADYQWAVVGSPSRKYLWILSRHEEMSRELFESIRRRAQQRGYAVDKLVMMAPLN